MSVVWNVGFCFCCSKHAQFCTSGIWCYSSHLQGSPCSNYVAAYQGSAISGMILTGLFSLLFILLIWQYRRLPCFDWLSLLTLAIVVCLCVWNCVVCQHIPSGISSPKGSKEVTYKIMQGILMGMIASLTSTTFFIAGVYRDKKTCQSSLLPWKSAKTCFGLSWLTLVKELLCMDRFMCMWGGHQWQSFQHLMKNWLLGVTRHLQQRLSLLYPCAIWYCSCCYCQICQRVSSILVAVMWRDSC